MAFWGLRTMGCPQTLNDAFNRIGIPLVGKRSLLEPNAIVQPADADDIHETIWAFRPFRGNTVP
jgi:hypothetical protein